MLLLVDDDDPFRSALAANLRDDGYEVVEFNSAESVPLDRLSGIAILLTDYLMKKEDGLAFAKRFHARFPGVPVIMITAFATAHLESEVARFDYLTLLQKPVDYDQLLHLLQHLLAQ
jgi:two-component system response regulator RegA